MQRYADWRVQDARVFCSYFVSIVRTSAALGGLLAVLCGAAAPRAEAQTAQFSYGSATLGGGFNDPWGLAVDAKGNIYAADSGNNVVKEIPPGCSSSSCVTTLGGGFSNPSGVAVDASGNVYVADGGNGAVKEMPPGCSSTSCVMTLGGGFYSPAGVAVDAEDNVYVADASKQTVIEMPPGCTSSSCVTTLGGGFSEPFGIAVDSSGNVYVTDPPNDAVKEMPAGCSSSACVTTLGGGFSYPYAVAVDGSGNVYVADTSNNALKEMPAGCSSPSCVTTVATGFSFPGGVAAGRNGADIYVGDSANNAVKEIMQGSLNFPATQIGSNSQGTLTFTFNSAGTIKLPSVTTEGVSRLDFADFGTGTCDNNGTAYMYSAGDLCTETVTFAPRYPGARYGAVNLLNSSGSVIATGYVNGTGLAPQAVFTPSTIGTLGGGFSDPFGVAVDAGGNVYVADSNNGVMKEMPAGCSSASCVTTLAGGFNVASGTPFGVAVDGSGNVYFSDSGLYQIPVGCTSAGCVVKMGSNTMAPNGLAVDGGGVVYAADATNNAVWEMPPGCILDTCTPASLGGGFNKPRGVAIDANGNIYVADTGNNAVKEMPAGCASAACVTTLGSGFSSPYGLAVDAGGDIYVADLGNNAIKEMPAGCASSSCVSTLDTGFNGPGGVALDENGNVYLTDSGNNAVKEIERGTPPDLTFATTEAGQTSSDSPKTVTVQNVGNAALTIGNTVLNISGVTYPTDFPEYSGVDTDCGTSSTQVGTGSSCTLSIAFSPLFSSLTSSSTSLNELVELNDNSLDNALAQQSVGVSGTATAPPATELAFGTPPADSIPVGGNAGSAITVSEEISGGTVDIWASDTITLTVTYPDDGEHTYTQAAVRGVATFNLSAVTLTESGSYTYTASLSGATSAMASEVVGSTTIVWSPAPAIIFGSGGSNVLNATVNCVSCGTISYTATLSGSSTPTPITSTSALAAGSYSIEAIFTPSNGGFAGTSDTQPLTVSGESVWVVDGFSGGIAELAGNGYAITSSADPGGSIAAAIDAGGNVWSIGTGANLLESVSQTGIPQVSITSGGGLVAPSAIAIDGASQVWVSNAGNNTFSLFLDNGSGANSPIGGFTDGSLSNPSGIAIDLGGSVWIANKGNNTITRILGAAAPAAPLSTAAKNNTTGSRP